MQQAEEHPDGRVSVHPRAPAPAWLLAAAAVFAGATLLGAALSPVLAVHHPVWLIVLNPWPRHQILVAPQLPLAPFILIVSLRGLFSCWVAFHLGRHFGMRGVQYLAGKSAEAGRTLQSFERLFGRFSVPFLLLAPGIWTAALAGMSEVSVFRTLGLSFIGLAAWGSVNHRLGGILAPWTTWLLQLVRENMLAATAICTVLVLVHQAWSRRKKQRNTPPDEHPTQD